MEAPSGVRPLMAPACHSPQRSMMPAIEVETDGRQTGPSLTVSDGPYLKSPTFPFATRGGLDYIGSN
jgi:hypothetical protein